MFRRRQSKFEALWRVADVACAVLVVFYVLFDVLDLDGSDLTRFNHTARSTSFQAYMSSELDLDFSSHKLESLNDDSIYFLIPSTAVGNGKWVETSQYSLLNNARDHGYRPGLARNSLPDKSPEH